VDRGERRPELVRHRREEVLADLLECALVADVLEGVDDAFVERAAQDRRPPLATCALERPRLGARGDASPAREQLLEPAPDDLVARDAGDRRRRAVPEPDDPTR